MKKENYDCDTLMSVLYGHARKLGRDLINDNKNFFGVSVSDTSSSLEYVKNICEYDGRVIDKNEVKDIILDKEIDINKFLKLYGYYGLKMKEACDNYWEELRNTKNDLFENNKFNDLISISKEFVENINFLSYSYGWNERKDARHFFDKTLNSDGHFDKKGITFDNYFKNRNNNDWWDGFLKKKDVIKASDIKDKYNDNNTVFSYYYNEYKKELEIYENDKVLFTLSDVKNDEKKIKECFEEAIYEYGHNNDLNVENSKGR